MKLWAKSCKSDKIIDLMSEIFHFESLFEPKLVHYAPETFKM